MKNNSDLVRGWLKKARSDELALEASVGAGALDAACFHAQQAAEKHLKAFLTHRVVEFPFIHKQSRPAGKTRIAIYPIKAAGI